jgi:hypothetical protein
VRKPGAGVVVTVFHSPSTRPAVTAADHQTSDAAAGKEEAQAENEYVEIGQHGAAREPKKERRGGEDRDFVVVIDDDLSVGEDLGDDHQEVEGEDYGSGDAEEGELGEAEMFDEKHGLQEGEEEAGVAAELEGINRTAKYLRAQRRTLTPLAIKTNSHRSFRFLNRARSARSAGGRASFGPRFRAADGIKPPDC